MKTSSLFIIMILISTVLFGASDLKNFNDTSDLTTWFNPDPTPVFTNIATGGIGNTGNVSIPLGSFDVWTGNYSFGLPSIGNQAILSGYFLIGGNSGYSGFGLATADTNEINSSCNITTSYSLGVQFHGGGGAFFNDTQSYELDWFFGAGDLQEGSWYQITFTIDRTAESTFDLEMDIWLSDSDGVLQSRHTIQTWSCTNTNISAATELYPYFCNGGERSINMDNFYVEAEDITLPVTMSSFTATPAATLDAVTLNWVVESETDHMGYNVFKSEDDVLANAFRINTNIIESGAMNYEYVDVEVESGATYYYWIESVDLSGFATMYGPAIATILEGEDPGETPELTFNTEFSGAFPNPFNPVTTLSYSLNEAGVATFTMFDLKGRKVGEMTQQGHEGSNQLTWDAQDLPSGIYFIRMSAGGMNETQKVMLLK